LAKDSENFVCVTLGTGIGAGIYVDGRIHRGANGGAGELGHMILDMEPDAPLCGCGNRGCFEALASGLAIARMARDIFANLPASSVSSGLDAEEAITARWVTRLANQGNASAVRILRETGNIIGIGFANVVNLFNPDRIIVTGSLVEAGDLILKPAMEVMMQRAFSNNAKFVRVIKSELQNRAGVLGAAALCRFEV
jgi:predicted NBD/HSP70 family sugar kinase